MTLTSVISKLLSGASGGLAAGGENKAVEEKRDAEEVVPAAAVSDACCNWRAGGRGAWRRSVALSRPWADKDGEEEKKDKFSVDALSGAASSSGTVSSPE
jgi:hypothetical protein